MELIQNKVLNKLEQLNLDALFVSSEENIRYLTGFTGDSSRLLITPDGSYLITDGRYREQAEQECGTGIQVFTWIKDQRYQALTYWYLCTQSRVQRLGFEGGNLSFSEYEELQKIESVLLQNCNGVVEEFRQVKSAVEIDCLRKAASLSDESLESIVGFIKPGVSELDLVAELEYAIKRSGADDISFETMILFGERTSLLHGKPGSRKLKEGDTILFDFGALYKGYHADISRVFVCGKASEEQKKVHQIVNTAGLGVLDVLRNGGSTAEVDRVVRNAIPKDYLEYFYPGIGHGTGLQIHEEPFIKQGNNEELRSGMVLTIEPGLYIPGWGGMREEDSILIHDKGCDPLNKFSRDLLEI
ncbi:M24 family metallopeptidase [Plebeiibacterium marinum]|uniref:Xaa-Pro peptidase family protein n=1 Tax=Plebeiibacterium marinum TaxID=2992111 RepID=A0AAE3MCM7_9BACT|nr:Xaa-Pro peptidase family protein [Plebeiobacterium marinum]MCW3805376.1 Xaa-Pro peptidase family protein [Plebeiobacterium marinum]